MRTTAKGRAETYARRRYEITLTLSAGVSYIDVGRPCAACSSEHAAEINRKLKAGTTHQDVSRWLAGKGNPITPMAIGRHARTHLAMAPPPRGRRPVSGDFLESVRDTAHEALASGDLAVTLKDGIAAQKALDARAARNADMDLMLKIAITLGGRRDPLRLPDPEVEAIEGEFRHVLEPELLTSGAE